MGAVWSANVLNRLTRITSGGSFIPEIDGLRFLAIFPVVMHHMLGTFLIATKRIDLSSGFNWQIPAKQSMIAHLISHGNYGVQFFFVISGFILALPFARQHFGLKPFPGLKKYFLRRVSRLEPTYIINLLLIMLVFVCVYKFKFDSNMFNHLLASTFYMHNQIYAAVSTISDVTWSLEVEIQFYILAPFMAYIYKVSNVKLRRLLIAAIIVVFQLSSPYNSGRLNLSLVNYIQFFMCGFLLADIYLLDWKELPRKTLGGDVLGCIGTILMALFLFEIVKNTLLLPVSILFLFAGVFSGSWFNRLMTQKYLVVIGGMCYTIYLYHNTIIYILMPRIVGAMPIFPAGNTIMSGFAVMTLIMLPLILLVSGILFALFERPFMQKNWYRFNRICDKSAPLEQTRVV